MSTGVPLGMTIKDGLLITSESMSNPAVGFYEDGTAIIGRTNLNIRIESPYLTAPIGSIHLNKTVTKASGVMLYTRVFGNDNTNKATIPTYNVLLTVDSEELRFNDTVEATVESVSSATGPTFIPPGRLLLTIASETDYPGNLANLYRLVPGIRSPLLSVRIRHGTMLYMLLEREKSSSRRALTWLLPTRRFIPARL